MIKMGEKRNINGILSAIVVGALGCLVGYGVYAWHSTYLDYCKEHGFDEDHKDAAGFDGRNYIKLYERE